MSDLQQFKCPACGGTIQYDGSTNKLKCEYCGNTFELDSLQQYQQDLSESIDREESWVGSNPEATWGEEADNAHYYVCKSCGGEIVTDSTTAATKCPYCDSPVVLNSQLSGVLKPDLVIPFKLDKKVAKEKYLEHLKGKPLVPKNFKDSNHIDEIKGVYVPCWLYDADVIATGRYRATKTRHYSDADYDYTDTSYYSVVRSASMIFDSVPVDGSTKIDSDLMESTEPYDYSTATDFKTAYLAGYLADKYNIDEKTSSKRAMERIKNSSSLMLESMITGYSTITPESVMVNVTNGDAKYCLLPIWYLKTTYKNENYIFVMNGQTGKFVGDLPVDKAALTKRFLLVFVIVTVVALLVSLFVL